MTSSAHSPGFALLPVATANGVLLAGLLAFDWAPATIALLFWIESAFVGVFALLRIALSLPGYLPVSGKSVVYERLARPGGVASTRSTVPSVGKLAAVPLFVVLYGGLLVLYGSMMMIAVNERVSAKSVAGVFAEAMRNKGVVLAVVVLAAQQIWLFWRDYLTGEDWVRSDATFHFWKPFGLFFLLSIAFVSGFWVSRLFGSALPLLVALVLLKTAADLFNAFFDTQAGPWQRVGAADT